MSIDKNSKIYIAGHKGMVGSAIWRELEKKEYKNLIGKSHKELDLTKQQAVYDFFAKEKPEYVIDAAAKVGGIYANDIYPAEFIYQNLMIQTNIVDMAYKNKVKKLIFLGSSCIYPCECPQPMKEEYLLTGPLEKTNEAYAISKIAGLKMCEFYNKQYKTNFISVMPTNLYGPNDNYNLETSHAMAALIRKFHEAKESEAKEVIVWGTGSPRREFLYVDDLAEAVVFLLENYEGNEIINIGTGEDLTIAELAQLVKEVIGFKDKIVYDHSKPDGTPQKLLDVSRLKKLGWTAKTSLKEGIKQAYQAYLGII